MGDFKNSDNLKKIKKNDRCCVLKSKKFFNFKNP